MQLERGVEVMIFCMDCTKCLNFLLNFSKSENMHRDDWSSNIKNAKTRLSPDTHPHMFVKQP